MGRLGYARIVEDYDRVEGDNIRLRALNAALLEALYAVSDWTTEAEECPVCGRPVYLDCIEDMPCGIARAAIRQANEVE